MEKKLGAGFWHQKVVLVSSCSLQRGSAQHTCTSRSWIPGSSWCSGISATDFRRHYILIISYSHLTCKFRYREYVFFPCKVSEWHCRFFLCNSCTISPIEQSSPPMQFSMVDPDLISQWDEVGRRGKQPASPTPCSPVASSVHIHTSPSRRLFCSIRSLVASSTWI